MELQVLLESYDEEKDIITRKGNAKASATRRTKAWQRIADRKCILGNRPLVLNKLMPWLLMIYRSCEEINKQKYDEIVILCVCSTGAVTAARTAAWQHLIQRNLWPQQTLGIPEPMRRQLLECPISPDGLFGPHLSSMVDEMQAA
ncbi:unnamed protein product [Boreogadus saida]